MVQGIRAGADAYLEEIIALHEKLRPRIEPRLAEFGSLWERGQDEELFAELAFCLLTPQSRARACWSAVEQLAGAGMLMTAPADEMAPVLAGWGVRFHNTKAARIALARELFFGGGPGIGGVLDSLNSPRERREWLVCNVTGLGYKEASHFLRNLGMGGELAILDRHILRNLARLGVIDAVPSAMTPVMYLDIEREMLAFSRDIGIPPDHLDMMLWYREAGEIFK